jgi:hypothetical protein
MVALGRLNESPSLASAAHEVFNLRLVPVTEIRAGEHHFVVAEAGITREERLNVSATASVGEVGHVFSCTQMKCEVGEPGN